MSKIFTTTYYTEKELAGEGFIHLGKNVRIARNCTVVGAHNISIGDNVRIDGYCTLAASGEGFIELGSYIHIGGYCLLLGAEGVKMDDFSTLSWGVHLFSRSDDFSGEFMTNPTVPAKYTRPTSGSIQINRHAVIGAKSVILPSVTVGEGSSVGTLSLVNKSLDSWGIYCGIPAKKIKSRKRHLLLLEKQLHDDFFRRTQIENALNK